MKRLTKSFLALFVLSVLLGTLCSCGAQDNDGAGTLSVVLGTDPETVYTVPLDQLTVTEGLMSVLEYLKEEENLTYTAEDSGYGAYLTAVGDLAQDSEAGKYIMLYTSVEEDADVSQYATTVTYGGRTLTSSGVGASSMHVRAGEVIYIGCQAYGA